MFAFLKGTVSSLSSSKLILDVNNIGYEVSIGPNVLSHLPKRGEPFTIFTSMVIRENSHNLYGFLNLEEKNTFEILINISGIGPKTALCLVSHLGLEKLQNAISEEDINTICLAPGIGKKTAQRLIVETKDKIGKQIEANIGQTEEKLSLNAPTTRDAINALINLGYKQNVAQKAIQKTLHENEKETLDLASLITHSLKHI
jgi:holliday junction DNA helicase RuvA